MNAALKDPPKPSTSKSVTPSSSSLPSTDQLVPLTLLQKAMFKQMTKSLAIPHFGYSEEIALNAGSQLRATINFELKRSPPGKFKLKKITFMPIFLKALSIALDDYPILNSCIINPEDPSKTKLQYRSNHNIGIAMDTSNGYVFFNKTGILSLLNIILESDCLYQMLRTFNRNQYWKLLLNWSA
jgi:2-oxoisovalerate dehydrogenase E2 component (dihydrolipoyl transacylase)